MDAAVDPAALGAAEPEARTALLDSRDGGLTSAEAAARLQRYGPNRPVAAADAHPLRMFASEFTHTLALLLWFAAGLAFAALSWSTSRASTDSFRWPPSRRGGYS